MARRRVTRKTTAYRILSVDGGVIRGLYAAVLLERLTREVPTLVDGVDLVAGTSTGGIIALGLANGLAPADLVALYRDRAKEIFDDSWLDDLKDLGGLTGVNPAYVAGKELDWGCAQWAKPQIALMVDGMMGVADYQCARLLQHRYFRLAPILPERIGLDDVDKIADLVKYAQDVDIQGAVAWLTRYFSPASIDN